MVQATTARAVSGEPRGDDRSGHVSDFQPGVIRPEALSLQREPLGQTQDLLLGFETLALKRRALKPGEMTARNPGAG